MDSSLSFVVKLHVGPDDDGHADVEEKIENCNEDLKD